MQKNWYKTEDRAYIKGITAFKGISALLIFIFHFWGFFGDKISGGGDNFLFVPFKAGHIALDIFFVLSGFLLFLSIAREGSVNKDFLIRRIKRLYPLAAFFSITFFLLKGGDYWLSAEGIKNLVYHLLFIQSLSFDTYWGLNPVMWFLTVELLFIIILPLLLKHIPKKKLFLSVIFLLMMTNFLYRAWIFRYFPEWTADERIFYSEQLWGRFDQFTLGVFLGVFWISKAKDKISALVSNSALFTGFFSFLIVMWIFAFLGSDFRESLFLQTFLHFFTSLFFAIFLFGYLTNKNTYIKQFFAPDLFSYLGIISYSFFLWHYPVLSFVHKLDTAPHVALIVSLALSILLSVFSYFFIENLFYKRFRGDKIKA